MKFFSTLFLDVDTALTNMARHRYCIFGEEARMKESVIQKHVI